MNTAIIGCGFIANLHAKAIRALGHTIFIVIDRDPGQAEAFAAAYGINQWSTHFEDALNDQVECIHICTPPTFHYEMIKAALSAGKHVISEKPLVLKNEQAVEIIQLAIQNKRVHAVNYNVRFYEACRRAQQIIRSPDFGPPMIIHGSYQQEFHILPAENSWRYQPELAGHMRAVTEIGSHWIDLARFLTGLEITNVSAHFANFTPNRILYNGKLYKAENLEPDPIIVQSEDAAVISLQFSNGSIGSILLSEVSHGRSNALAIEVVGEKQSIWWQSENSNELTLASKGEGIKTQIFPFAGGYPETFADFFEKVYHYIEFPSVKIPDFPTFIDGAINTRVCNAIYDSAQQNSAWISVNYGEKDE